MANRLSMSGRRPRVLVLGGWSPGPLDRLRARFADVDFEEPAIPMPPAGLRWCLNPFFAALLLYAFVVVPVLMSEAGRFVASEALAWALRAAGLALSLVVLRLLVAGLVWYSIRDAVWVARRVIRSWQPDVVMGFSWGGGVACWLLAGGGWDGPTILLAPTVRAMARASCSGLPRLAPSAGAACTPHVFHANDDGFCPESQVHDFRAAGWEVHVCHDDHVLCRSSSVEKIAGELARALGRSTGSCGRAAAHELPAAE